MGVEEEALLWTPAVKTKATSMGTLAWEQPTAWPHGGSREPTVACCTPTPSLKVPMLLPYWGENWVIKEDP